MAHGTRSIDPCRANNDGAAGARQRLFALHVTGDARHTAGACSVHKCLRWIHGNHKQAVRITSRRMAHGTRSINPCRANNDRAAGARQRLFALHVTGDARHTAGACRVHKYLRWIHGNHKQAVRTTSRRMAHGARSIDPCCAYNDGAPACNWRRSTHGGCLLCTQVPTVDPRQSQASRAHNVPAREALTHAVVQ